MRAPHRTSVDRMRRSLFVVSLALAACAPQGVQPPPTVAVAPPAPRPPLECSAFSLLVNRNGAAAAAVDPVETQMAVMQSRAFFATAPSWLAPSGTMSLERVAKSALISVRIHAQPSRSGVVCDWLERRALEMAQPERAEASQWLAEQIIKFQHDAEASQDELASFDKAHELLAVSLDDQIALAREQLKALRTLHRSAANDAALRSATDRALQLNLQEIERNRLVRNVANTTRVLDAIRERRASNELDDMLNRPVVLLDHCGPCPAP